MILIARTEKIQASKMGESPFFEVESLAKNSFLRTAMLCLIVIYIITLTSQQHVNLHGYVDEGGSDTVV